MLLTIDVPDYLVDQVIDISGEMGHVITEEEIKRFFELDVVATYTSYKSRNPDDLEDAVDYFING